jgi:hypothetical protein
MPHSPLLRFFVQFETWICYKEKVNIFASGKGFLFAAAIFACALPVQANIGDTLTQLRGRYGSAKDMGGQMLFEVRLVKGQITPARGTANAADHFSITVYFDGDHSGMEVFTRNTSDPGKANMIQSDIDSILAAESDGHTWVPIQVASGKPTWSRTDKKIIARFSPNKDGKVDDASVLIIMLNN